MTKPDYNGWPDPHDIPEWRYSNEQLCTEVPEVGQAVGWAYPDGASCTGPSVTEVGSRFYRNDRQIAWWPAIDAAHPEIDSGYIDIMAYIVPARTHALGQVDTAGYSVGTSRDYSREFTTSNQGHSAEFHGYLGELHQNRVKYWVDVMETGFGLEPLDGDLSGLYPNNGGVQ